MPTTWSLVDACRARTTIPTPGASAVPFVSMFDTELSRQWNGRCCRCAYSTSQRGLFSGNSASAGLAVVEPTCFPTGTLSRVAGACVVQAVILRGGNRMGNATGVRHSVGRPAGEQDRALRELPKEHGE